MGLGNMSGQRLYTTAEVHAVLDQIHAKKLRAFIGSRKTSLEQYSAEHGELNGVEYTRKNFQLEADKLFKHEQED